MFINYFTGPGLVRLYWLELLTETVGARKRAELARPSHVRTLLGWILRGLGKRLSRLGERLTPQADPAATQFCG
jgi:hypothetical protein